MKRLGLYPGKIVEIEDPLDAKIKEHLDLLEKAFWGFCSVGPYNLGKERDEVKEAYKRLLDADRE